MRTESHAATMLRHVGGEQLGVSGVDDLEDEFVGSRASTRGQVGRRNASSPTNLSSEMESFLEAIAAGGRSEYVGHGWWKIEGARRGWHTTTVRALLRRGRIKRAEARVVVLTEESR